MATWRYSKLNGVEMAAVGGSTADTSSSRALITPVPDYFDENNSEDLSYSDLDEFPQFLMDRSTEIRSLHIDHNSMANLAPEIGLFSNLVSLDVSNNCLKLVADEICGLYNLRTFIARNNCLSVDSFPKDFGSLPSLAVVNLSGNALGGLPIQLTELQQLRCLYLGANQIAAIPPDIRNMSKLEILYLGGNQLTCIPDELGNVTSLVSLVLSDNQLESLPSSLVNLSHLQSLSLHNNRLSTLPPEIIRLNLVELSLRNNPLVVRFVEGMTYDVPSLLELAGRTVKLTHIPYCTDEVPCNLVSYLDSAQQCVNPRCNGVYFTSRVEHVKFVDFCGKYRLPLMQYLCSPQCNISRVEDCTTAGETDNHCHPMSSLMKRVLLG